MTEKDIIRDTQQQPQFRECTCPVMIPETTPVLSTHLSEQEFNRFTGAVSSFVHGKIQPRHGLE